MTFLPSYNTYQVIPNKTLLPIEDNMSNQLQALREITTVVADTGDIEAIKKYQPVDATTNPSLLLKAAEMPQYQSHLESAVAWAKQRSSDTEQQIIDAGDKLSVTIGTD